MVFKIFTMLVIFKMVSSDPVPNVNIDINQEVNAACCPGSCCPKESENAGCTLEDCEAAGDCFLSDTHQCFCRISSPPEHDWYGADEICKDNSLKLPHPYNVVDLQSRLVQEWGNLGHIYMDGKCNGDDKMVWRDNNVEITEWNPFFAVHPWNPNCTDGDVCLEMHASEKAMFNNPGKPYWTHICEHKHTNLICEKPC